MSGTSRHDAWQAGSSYEAYMGRWSRRLAPRFLDWLDLPDRLDWLDVGCGTGALSAAVFEDRDPASLVGIDPSADFVSSARESVPDPRATFRVGDAQSLEIDAASRDVAVSALVLNFVPDRGKALAEMNRVVRDGGRIAFYVWDYPGDGIEFISAFWNAAAELDPGAADLAEAKRFPFCTPAGLTALAEEAGLRRIECAAIGIDTEFADFDDYWTPFTFGAGPAPGYCASLPEEARERLKARLDASLPRSAEGTIPMMARAWAVTATAA